MGRTGRKRLKKNLSNPHTALDHEDNAINLRKFMTRNGFRDEINLKLRSFPETGRGVATGKPLHENEVIIRVPYNLMVTYKTLQSLKFTEIFIASSKLTIHDLLATFLAVERHKRYSFWSAYIDSLPPKPPWIPSLLSEEYMELLPADLRLAVEKSRRLLEESWSRIRKSIKSDWTCSCCGKKADCVLDLNTFRWGYILVNTRAVYVNPETIRELCDYSEDILSDQPCMALCPYLDMFNHSHVARTKAELVHLEGTLVYQLTTLTETKKYEQIFISYGPHDNVKLLVEYGFFIPGNCYDSVLFKLEDVLKVLELKLSDFQYRFIRNHDLDKSSVLYISQGGPSFNLKALLFVASRANEVKNFASVIYGDRYPKDFLEEVIESCRKLLHFQLNVTEEVLNKFQALWVEFKDESSLIIDFLEYRRKFVKALCDNKQ